MADPITQAADQVLDEQPYTHKRGGEFCGEEGQ